VKFIGATLIGLSFYWFLLTTGVYLVNIAEPDSAITTTFYLASVLFSLVCSVVGRSIYPKKEYPIENEANVSSAKRLVNLNLMKLNVIGWLYVYSIALAMHFPILIAFYIDPSYQLKGKLDPLVLVALFWLFIYAISVPKLFKRFGIKMYVS